MKYRRIIIISLISIGFVLDNGCATNSRHEPTHLFESYRFNENSSLISRVTKPPVFVLNYLKKLDNNPDYEPFLPNGNEIKIIEDALNVLPPLNKRILNKRLIGIYFIRNFLGNGLTDWVVDSQNTVYTILVFNSGALTKSLSELLTVKEKTCFQADDQDYNIYFDCGKKYNGFNYILLHESTHAVDYIKNITPYADEQYKKYMHIEMSETEFTKTIWKGYDAPRGEYAFSKRVFFYGSSKPKLRMSKAAEVYTELSHSPFVSLYGSLSWAEDLAELVTFYHITHVLCQPYVINITRRGEKILSVYPMESPEVRKRLPLLQIFYRTGAL
jgi:hypothetical protein